jgi:hypothetical protein
LSDILEIKEISYGEFAEISGLNQRFKPGSKKIKIVLDICGPGAREAEEDLTAVFVKLQRLLPSLDRHQCGEHLFEDLRLGRKTLYSQVSDKITAIAHMMEHVIIDLQSKITGMDSCSGVTCGYKQPSYRFDLFVECKDKNVGAFSACFAADLLERLLSRKRLSGRYRALIELAGFLYRKGPQPQPRDLEVLISRIRSEFGWKRDFVLPLLKILKGFGFLKLGDSLAG